MIITDHAKERYLSRIKGQNPKYVPDSIMEEARRELADVARNPDQKYQEKGEDYPIHIKGNVAVPVKFCQEEGEQIVPSAYESTTFINNGRPDKQ